MRPVREDVAEVTAAGGAQHLGALHAEGRVGLLLDRLRVSRRGKRGPAAAGVVLGVGGEELGPTTGALVGARLEAVVVLTSERPLGALLPQDAVLLGAELGTPLLFGFLDLGHVEQSCKSSVRYAGSPRAAQTAETRKARLRGPFGVLVDGGSSADRSARRPSACAGRPDRRFRLRARPSARRTGRRRW